MSTIYVDAAKPRVRVWQRRIITALIILLMVALANIALFLTLNLARAIGYPLPHPAIALLTHKRLHVGDTASFSAAGSQGRELAYTWSFGDGQTLRTTSSGPVAHTYQDSGRFTVALTATDPVGHQVTRHLTITVFPPPPEAAIVTQPDPYQPLTMELRRL